MLRLRPITYSFFFILFLLLGKGFCVFAQDTIKADIDNRYIIDSLSNSPIYPDTVIVKLTDSLGNPIIIDSLTTDSISAEVDSTSLLWKHPVSENKIDSPVDYKAKDSISFNMRNKQAFLYHNGEILYENIELQADYIIVDFDKRELYAEGVSDSLGEIQGQPIFIDGGKNYNSENLRYNFDSKKGIITHIITQEGEGYLHGDRVKKMNDSVMYLNSGRFTTCDLDHPHFAIEFSKSKLITGDRIVTSTAYLSIEDVPTPLIIPFGVFPFSKTRSSGILIPSYGWTQNRGYYLQRGGYYFAFNDYVDLELRGDIYTNTSWAVNANSNYYKKYKFKGNINLTFDKVKQGIKGTSNYQDQNNFKIYWKHEQDAKANPRSKFSADVNFVSQSYGRYSTNTSDYFNNTTSSSINYYTKIGNLFNANITLRESYNSRTKIYDFSLPEFRFYSNQIEPFKRKRQVGTPKWYEKIYFSYTFDMANKISSPDSLLFTKGSEKNFKNGISHTIPISYSTKILKHFNWTNSITYNERWYLQYTEQQHDPATGKAVRDTIYGFKSNREANFSSRINTQIYGMFNFKSNLVKAIRHVMTPTLEFSYRPDFGNPDFGFWKSYYDTELKENFYSVFENSLYGGPPRGESGNLNFSLKNNLEMKIRDKKDTATGTRKIVLIEDLTFSMGYDLAKDSLNFSNLVISGRTSLFKGLRITYNASFSPYCIDSTGIYNEFLWKKEKKLFRKESATWELGLNYTLNPETFKKNKDGDNTTQEETTRPELPIFSPFNNPNEILGTYVDFSVPWNITIDYRLKFVNKYVAKAFGYENSTIQTLNLYGDFSLTPNWRIGFSSGYDFELKEITYTSIDVYRDLHCWEMRFNWVPFGARKSWNFTIAVKANMLKDAMKYEMKHDFRDNENFYH